MLEKYQWHESQRKAQGLSRLRQTKVTRRHAVMDDLPWVSFCREKIAIRHTDGETGRTGTGQRA